jgi:cell division protein FtsN
MPRDYADSTNKNTKSGQPAGWVWLLGGLAIGLFVAFLVYLNNNTHPSRKEALSKAVEQTLKEPRKEAEIKTPLPATTETPAVKPAPKFDFYYILPELEVAVPDQELAKATEPNKTLAPNTDYILQAASFRSHDDADRLKAKLALQGVDANIQTVTINNDSWHRVRIGPIRDVASLNRTRKRLQENGITAIVIKAK